MIAAIMKPYFSEQMCWVISHHPVIPPRYYAHNAGDDPDAREEWLGHPWFDHCAEFCERTKLIAATSSSWACLSVSSSPWCAQSSVSRKLLLIRTLKLTL